MLDPTENGDNTRQFALDSSAYLRSRNQKSSDTIHGAYARASKAGLQQNLSQIRDQTMTLGRVPLATIDAITTFATWLGAYKKAMKVADTAHEDAVFQADRETARAHGSHFPGDVPRVMMIPNTVGGEVQKSFVAFYNFFNHFWNNTVQTAWDIRSRFPDRQTEANATIASISGRLATVMLVSMVEEMVTGWGSNKHEGWGWRAVKGLLKTLGGGIVGVRELTGALEGGYGPNTGLYGTLARTVYDEGRDVMHSFKTGKLGKDWLPHLAGVLGLATGGVGPAAARVGQFVGGTIAGTEKPRGPTDVVRGIFTGHARPKEERPR
jgi:hypothetical protein